MAAFEMKALGIIIPFAIGFLIGVLCICRHKIFLWRLGRNNEPEQPAVAATAAAAGGSALNPCAPAHVKKVSIDIDKYEAPSDCEAGNGGTESESEAILVADHARKDRKVPPV